MSQQEVKKGFPVDPHRAQNRTCHFAWLAWGVRRGRGETQQELEGEWRLLVPRAQYAPPPSAQAAIEGRGGGPWDWARTESKGLESGAVARACDPTGEAEEGEPRFQDQGEFLTSPAGVGVGLRERVLFLALFLVVPGVGEAPAPALSVPFTRTFSFFLRKQNGEEWKDLPPGPHPRLYPHIA